MKLCCMYFWLQCVCMSFSITVFIPFLYPVFHRRTKKELLYVQSSTSLRRAATNIIFSTVVLSQKPLRKSPSLKLNAAVQTKFLCFRATCLFQNLFKKQQGDELEWVPLFSKPTAKKQEQKHLQFFSYSAASEELKVCFDSQQIHRVVS